MASPTPSAPKPKDYRVGTGGKKSYTKTPTSTGKKYQVGSGKPTGIDKILGDTISAGEGFLNTISMPLYHGYGVETEKTRQANLSPEEYKKEFGTYPISYYKPAEAAKLGIAYFAQSEAKARAKQNAAGNANATAWQRGQKVITGQDIATNPKAQKSLFQQVVGTAKPNTPEAFWQGLALDVGRDPLTFAPGGIVLRPIKAAITGTRQFFKTAKAAATLGEVSVAPAARAAASKAAKAGATKAEIAQVKTDVAATGKVLKPGYSILSQYTRKPIIKQNLKQETGLMGEKLGKIENLISKNLTYKTTQLPIGQRATISQIVGSATEAGYKAAASTLVQIYGRQSLRRLSAIEANIARKELKAAKKAGKVVDNVVETTTKAGIDAARILDNEISKVEPTIQAKQAVVPKPSDVAVKNAEKLVTDVEKISAGAKGLQPQGNNVRSAVTKILEDEVKISEFSKRLKAENLSRLNAIISGDVNPFDALRVMASSSDKQLQDIVRLIVPKKIVGKDGTAVAIGDLIRGGADFNKFSKQTQKKILAEFAAFTTAGKLKSTQLSTILDDKVVQAILKTNVLDSTKATNDSALIKILEGLPDGTQQIEKTYANFADLIGGLKAGEQVDFKVLEKLLKAIDPEAAIIKQIDKALTKEQTYETMRNILMGEGVNTVYAAQRRLQLLDADTLMTAQGLSNAEMIASYTSARLAREIDESELAADFKREKASANVAGYMDDPGKDGEVFRDVLYNINSGYTGYQGKTASAEGQFDYLRNLIEQGDALEAISLYDDLVVKSSDLRRAILPDQFNQSVEARILSSLFGIARTRWYPKAGSTKAAYTDEQILQDLIKRTTMLDEAVLAIFGGRIAHQKFVKTGEPKHFVHNTIGDFIRIFTETGRGDLVIKALVPNLKKIGITKTDRLSFIGIGKAFRYIAEMTENNVEPVRDTVIMHLKSMGEADAAKESWSPKYRAQVDQFIGELADHLASPDVVTAFKTAHAQRSMSAVEDALKSAESIVDDQFKTMYNGFIVNLDQGIDSEATRAMLAREWFNKFVYASNIFRNNNGETAKSVYQAAALVFMKKGRTAGGEALIGSPGSRNPAERSMFEESIRLIEEMYKYSAAEEIVTPGREIVKKITPEAQAKLRDSLQSIEDRYRIHALDITNQRTEEEINAWIKHYNKLQKEFDKIRVDALEANIPVRNWVDGNWVPADQYNRELALEAMQASGKGLIVTDKGIINVTDKLVDEVVKPIRVYKMTAEQRRLFMERWTNEAIIKNMELVAGDRETGAREILDILPSYEKIGLTDGELGLRLVEDLHKNTFDAATIRVADSNADEIRTLTGAVDSAAAASGEFKLNRFDRLAEHFNPEQNKWELRSLGAKSENALIQSISNISDFASKLQKSYETFMLREPVLFDMAVAHALGRVPLPEGVNPTVASLTADIRKMIDPLFGDPATSKVIAARIHPDALKDALIRYGLLEIAGITDPSLLTPAQLVDFAARLPFAPMPSRMIGTDDAAAWEKAAQAFADSKTSKLYVISNLAKAVQYAMKEQQIAIDFTNQFGWKHHFATIEQANAAGWVAIKGMKKGTRSVDLTRYLPKPEDGGLYPPEIAEQFLSLNRFHNALNNREFMRPEIANSMRLIMNLTGFIKATFTIFRGGHHVGNMVGDSSTAVIGGAWNPVWWAQGTKLAVMFMQQDAKAAFGAKGLADKMNKMLLDIPMNQAEREALDKSIKEGVSEPKLLIRGKDGKTKSVPLPYEVLFRYNKQNGALSGNIYQNDIQGQYDTLMDGMAKIDGAERKLMEVAASKLREKTATLEKGPGAFASYYSNIPRMATFMKVLGENRIWSSAEEALDTAHREVLRLHPNISSLAAGERRTARLAFTFYSWIKVAHIAMVDMILDNTGALLAFPKAQYNLAQANGMEPESFGDPWNPNLKGAPTRMTRSLYGPTEIVDGNVTGYGRNILPLDVFNFWNLVYDPAYSVDRNLMDNWNNVGRTLGQNINPFAQAGMNWVDPSLMPELTGDVPALQAGASPIDVILQKTGFYGAAQGAGGYTPGQPLYELRKMVLGAPVKALEINDAEMARKARNWIWGQKEFVVGTPSMIKEAKTEETKRRKAWIERQGK